MKKQLCSAALALSLLLCSCAAPITDEKPTDGSVSVEPSTQSGGSAVTVKTDTSELFSDRDYEIGYDESESAVIMLNGSSATCDSDAVTISGSTVTITDEGTYILSGTLTDGMVIVNAEKSDKIQLVLNGAEIHSATSAALYILQADKVFLTLATGTENTLSNGGAFVAIDENNIDAALFSKEDLTLNGTGTLTVNSPAGHGIVSKDDLVFTGGSYVVTAAAHALSGKDCVNIASGSFTLTAGKDGIHAENADDATLGSVYIGGGDFTITADGDGISGESAVQITDGDFTIVTAGGSAAVTTTQGNNPWNEWQSTGSAEDTVSCKGIKAAGNISISGGIYSIDAADDALHSNDALAVSGGTFALASGDDGMHADAALTISSGTITISKSYEGIEGLTIDISGGDINLTASDDGLNAAGGNDSSGYGGFGGFGGDGFGASSDSYIHISGGRLIIDAGGDGVDSNGALTVSGGETYVSGPTDSANAALDYGGAATITGGIFVAAGAAGMATNFGNDSTQGSAMLTANASAGAVLTVTDASGNSLLSFTAQKAFTNIVVSCPAFELNGTYTFTLDTASVEVTFSSLILGSGGGMGGMGGGRR